MATDHRVEVDGRRLKVTNLGKVLYPDAGFTKAEVIDYYVRVAPAMLPHIADRGVTLRRYPDGVDGGSFFEKRCPSHRPDWIGTYDGPGDRNGTIGYCALDSVAALAWSANMAALEIHAPMARGRRHRRPDDVRVRPRPRARAPASRSARAVALEIRDVLERLADLTCLAKTSGSKGLQLYVPLNTPHTHEHCSSFAQAVAQVLEQPPRRSGHVGDEEERTAPGRSSSTGARTAATRPRSRCTRSRARPRADGLHAGGLGRGRRRRGRRTAVVHRADGAGDAWRRSGISSPTR